MKQKALTFNMSSQRKLGSCLRIEDSSLRWSDRKGFTLIELSIVLVIIGLIVGGVLVGQDLIRAAEMRAIHGDWTKFETARQTFRLKYNCIPGDCANAATLGLGTNGDGNKRVNHPLGNVESWQYWSQMAAAGLIEGNYTGAAGSGGDYDAIIGENVPAAPLSGLGYSMVVCLSFVEDSKILSIYLVVFIDKYLVCLSVVCSP